MFLLLDRDEEDVLDDDDYDDADKGVKKVPADEEEILDLLQMLLNFRDNDAGTGLHYATKVRTNFVLNVFCLKVACSFIF